MISILLGKVELVCVDATLQLVSTMKTTSIPALLSTLVVLPCMVWGFGALPNAQISATTRTTSSATVLSMVPRFDPATQKWIPATEEESDAANYPPIRSLLRHGPKAFTTRITNPDTYDQAVLKFMAGENVERWEAQGNMDRFNENAQDWLFERAEAVKKGRKLDYVTLRPKQVILSSIWAGIVFWFLNDLFQRYVF